jgi:hypothetical protein
LAEKELGRLDAPPETDAADGGRDLEPVREAVRTAQQLRSESKAAEADAVLQGLRDLYKGDPEADALIKD